HVIAAVIIVNAQLPFVSFYLVPWMIGGVMNARRVIREHDHHEIRDQQPGTVWASTRTSSSWLGRVCFYPHNIGFHQAHHLYPAIAFGSLPQIHTELLKSRS